MAGLDIGGFDWEPCILCQEKTDENTKKDDVERNYTDKANLLGEFFKIRKLPQSFHSSLSDLIRHSNLADIFLQKQAKWHRSCKSKITTSKLEKCQTSSTKRKNNQLADSPVQAKVTRSCTVAFDSNKCFIPGCSTETSEQDPLHEVMSKELDRRFREYAMTLDDTELLSKLAGGDLIALEARYHSNCAVMYRNRVRLKLRGHSAPQSQSRSIRKHEQLAFLRVVSDIEEYRYDTSAPPFLLSNLVKQYESALKELMPHELWTPSITHSTRLKEIFLTEIPDLQYFKSGKQGYSIIK